MKTVKRSARWLVSVLVAVVLTFGASQALSAADSFWDPFCPGTCPPETGGVNGSCWDLCVTYDYIGGDCDPSGECCCFE